MENSNVNEDSGMKVDPIGDSSSPAPQPPVDERLQKALDNALYAGGRPAAQKIRNFLNGTWLGEPLHVVLKDVPAGAWTVAMVQAPAGTSLRTTCNGSPNQVPFNKFLIFCAAGRPPAYRALSSAFCNLSSTGGCGAGLDESPIGSTFMQIGRAS